MKPAANFFFWITLVAGSLAMQSQPTLGQISPGELSTAHQKLDGSDQCLTCHSSGRGVDQSLCLSCHKVLAARIAAGRGLHSRTENTTCERCHIEHHGREFELVWWGEEGMEAFDHSRTGYPLEAGHSAVDCRSCHQSTNIPDPAPLRAESIGLERTFLGLDVGCASCHADPHGRQFEDTTCATCHEAKAWKPANRFDHRRTEFPLTGLHREVSCSDCHRVTDEPIVYRGLAAESCSNCHRDPHAGRLVGACSSCHSPDGWEMTSNASFDHDRTRYPLRGRHRSVACTACHGESLATSTAIEDFDRCETCHQDAHAGQLSRNDQLCADCHSVSGFQPSLFDLADHQETAFPLMDSHQTVPCLECHRQVPAETLVRDRLAAAPRTARLLQFRFTETSCESCHRDPHEEEIRSLASGCRGCHTTTQWSEVAFDHSRTGLPLEGRHADVQCLQCHLEVAGATDLPRIPFFSASAACSSCHASPHQGQFDESNDPTTCARCHDSSSWEPSGFDHDRDAYLLVGAHRAVPCRTCHPTEVAGETTFVRYRPIGSECLDCHAPGTSR
ncbi:MAG: hypothetical protein K8J08_17440 [Thermoanaerobaculia bacterium]|nr:hypothetical protein [Thermoanaerobaculia bacterium]